MRAFFKGATFVVVATLLVVMPVAVGISFSALGIVLYMLVALVLGTGMLWWVAFDDDALRTPVCLLHRLGLLERSCENRATLKRHYILRMYELTRILRQARMDYERDDIDSDVLYQARLLLAQRKLAKLVDDVRDKCADLREVDE